ncbi:hypothetical protein AOL_s00054g462 [Orbilia oligospora ATCC 24927]|uniref:Uncharacterized protein n=2 Tax=Orbilia oligospora TaxID=2813651 RepID=G1X6G8_ARTOA|nr:hypothetical protein AOL_s00054g462 [Orbilia oligospora ATCC 24927]EGX51392.1 hypothetical protein AOL_s00054g462 [Orbilia oligospora ATCC 24927]KAF3280854.1 Anaphase-promoting complex subunit 1 [Orbilia oligospora]
MAQITTLGEHKPSALPYCFAEKLLSDPPPPNSYQWTLSPHVPDEELLVVKDTVIWSQGGVIQRVYRYRAEKQNVQQALFAWFFDDENVVADKKDGKRRKKANQDSDLARKKTTWNSKSRTYATQLGSFPKMKRKQKDVAFMDIDEEENPEDEDSVFEESGNRALIVLLKNEAFIYFLTGTSYVVHLPCDVQYALAAPNGVMLQGKYSLPDVPRLFILKDPLSDLGMVLDQDGGSAMDPGEEILFMERIQQKSASMHSKAATEVIVAVTRNIHRGHITIWQAKYIPQGQLGAAGKRTPSLGGTLSRRRSSFGAGTGAATPAVPNPSMISPEQSLRLDFDKEKTSNRRVSSLVARADLGGSVDRVSFSDMAKAGSSSFRDVPPIDALLDELNSNINLETLGQTEVNSLRNEILFTKIKTIPYSLGPDSLPLAKLPRIFTVLAPRMSTASENEGQRAILVIVNNFESRILQVILQLPAPLPAYASRKRSLRKVTLIDVLQKSGKDAVQILDNNITKLLVLKEDGQIEIGAPWCPPLNLPIPPTLARSNMHTPGQMRKQKRDFARSLSLPLNKITGLTYPEAHGRVSLIDEKSIIHRLSIQICPKDEFVKQALETGRYVLPAPRGGEAISVAWMEIMRTKSSVKNFAFAEPGSTLEEWKGFVMTIMLLGVSTLPQVVRKPRRRTGLARISSASSATWEDMLTDDYDIGPQADFLRSTAWEWVAEIEEQKVEGARASLGSSGLGPSSKPKKNNYFIDCMTAAREFLTTKEGKGIEKELFTKSNEAEVRRTSFAMLIVGLHILREEWKLDLSMEPAVRKMGALLVQMCTWMGWFGWVSGYMADDIEMESWEFDNSRFPEVAVNEPHFKQPSIYDWLVECFQDQSRAVQIPFMTLHDIVVPKNNELLNTSNHCAHITPKTRLMTELYSQVRISGRNFENTVAQMIKLGITWGFLEKLPEGVAIPFIEAIARVQESPPTSWGEFALELISRKDLKLVLSGKGKNQATRWTNAPLHEGLRDAHTICSTTLEPESLGAFDGSAEMDRTNITKLIWPDDRRWNEAVKLLQSSRPCAVKFIPDQNMTEQEQIERQQSLAQFTAMRTLAVPSGRGLLYYSARIPLLTEKFPTPGFNLTSIMKPGGFTVSAEKVNYTEEKVCWAFFHAGVAAGLSISKEAHDIDTSWIVFNKPSELSNRHAGFLLALGLNGHLKSIAKWDAFNYLTPKHTMTCIGLLLGLAASYLGTMDNMITKLLSVHVVRLLPHGSADLNLSPLTQTAGIMGVGLLYYNTQHRRMSEMLLSEIEEVENLDPSAPPDNLRDEGYRLAAGFALGFINLGKGHDLKSLQDLNIVTRLLGIAVGSKNIEMIHSLDKSTASATIALALIYMKTNDEALAKKIDVPETTALMDYVRPDIFLLRTLAKHLIMWDNIEPSLEWISNNFPGCLKAHCKLDSIKHLDSSHLPLFNIVGGLCFAIGLKYAGTMNEKARDTLLYYLDQFTRLCLLSAVNYDQKLSRATARNCQAVIALSAATIMAGSGDIPVLRRLRRMHGKIDGDMPFGSHLATHIAIGVLFLAGGTFTFGTSNLAIGSLLLAFYPLYPNSILDNRSHLQAFRHFWVLAAEPRCLVPREVETNRPISIPVEVTMKDGTIMKHNAPCILPDLDNVAGVKTGKPGWWPAVLDFDHNPEHLLAFQKTQTIYVQPRPPQFAVNSIYRATFTALEEEYQSTSLIGFEWVLGLDPLISLDQPEKAWLLPNDVASPVNANMRDTTVDSRLLMERTSLTGVNADRLRNVKLLFAFVDWLGGDGLVCMSKGSVERLRAAVWTAFS